MKNAMATRRLALGSAGRASAAAGLLGRRFGQVLVALSAAHLFGCTAEVADSGGLQPPPAAPQTLAAAAPIAETMSPGAVIVYWANQDEEHTARALTAFAENSSNTSLRVDLELLAAGLVGEVVSRPLRTVNLAPGEVQTLVVPVGDVPVQSPDDASTLMIVARYTSSQGVEVQEASAPLYLTYAKDYSEAVVRSPGRQASVRPPALGTRTVGPRGRKFDQQNGKIINADSVKPTEAADLIAYPIASGFTAIAPGDPTAPPAPDAVQQPTSAVVPKSETLTLCQRWQYSFRDAGGGSDRLNHYNGLTYGGITASRNLFNVQMDTQIGTQQVLTGGVLTASGCTPAMLLGGHTIRLWVYPTAVKNSITMKVEADNSGSTAAWYTDFNIGTSGTRTIWTDRGLGNPVAAAAAVVSLLIEQSDRGLLARTYKIFAQQRCSSSVEGCYDPNSDAVFLEKDNFGNWLALSKFIVAHELGHNVAEHLQGPVSNSYGQANASTNLCTCSHVTSANALHCLQSREFISTAQVEGWAQFYAANVFNVGSQTDCSFMYYKEFRPVTGAVQSPPVQTSCVTQHRWLEQRCVLSNSGVELDWMNFLYAVKNRNASTSNYTFGNLEQVYERACGGTSARQCTRSDSPKWSATQDAASAVFGSTNAKFIVWKNQGVNFGVDN